MDKKKRLKELNDFVGKDKVIFLHNLIDDVIYMEERLEELKKLPFIRVNPKNKEQQKKTESSKLYLSVLNDSDSDSAHVTISLGFLSYFSSHDEMS